MYLRQIFKKGSSKISPYYKTVQENLKLCNKKESSSTNVWKNNYKMDQNPKYEKMITCLLPLKHSLNATSFLIYIYFFFKYIEIRFRNFSENAGFIIIPSGVCKDYSEQSTTKQKNIYHHIKNRFKFSIIGLKVLCKIAIVFYGLPHPPDMT